jgi:hypothetical protein
MGAMRISSGPGYRKTGSPREKARREIQCLMEGIFSEILTFASKMNPPQQTKIKRQRDRRLAS